MTLPTTRRTLLQATGAIAAATLAPAAAFAASRPSRLYARAMVVNGNLVVPIDPDARMDAALTREVRSSGVTVLKASLGGSAADYAATIGQMGEYDRAIALNPETYMQVWSAADFAKAKRTGRIGIIYSFESVEMLEGRIARIDEFSARGVRVMQLSYNRVSPFASGVLSPQPSAGLTPLGREAIARMNALGVSLDLSHSDERSTRDALGVCKGPALITHAGCAAVYDHPRNKTDAVLRAVADTGGVVGVYELPFLAPGPKQTTLDQYMAHLLHALKVCGEDHVGMGSDALLTTFDTSPESMAAWNADIAARKASGVGAPGEGPPPFVDGLNRPDRMAVVAGELSRRGYKDPVVEKVLGLNFQRAFTETWTPRT
jgi:membrane dipeptidase